MNRKDQKAPVQKHSPISELEDASRCEFCNLQHPDFANEESDALDLHYINKCQMLTNCKGCSKIVEISKYANHLVSECEEKASFKQCMRCLQVFQAGDEYRKHVSAVLSGTNQQGFKGPVCEIAISKKVGIRCPLCDKNFVMTGQAGWRAHLVSEGCPANPRN